MSNALIKNIIPLTELLLDVIDNRGKTVPVQDSGFPLIATNCIKHSSIYPTFEKIRYISQETKKNWFRSELQPDDILFVNKGSPGRVCMVPNPVTFCAAQDMIGLRVKKDIVYVKYLFAVLRSSKIQEKIANFHVGIAIPHFKKSDLHNIEIPLPKMNTQRKIGDLYFSMSEKIELNNKICSELESLAQDLYHYWFTQFDFPDENGKPYRSSGGRMEWNKELRREIPEGWNVGTLANIATIIMGQSPNGNSLNVDENGLIFFQGCTDFTFRFPTRRLYTTEPSRIAQSGDILLSVRAPVGMINIAIDKCCIGRGLSALHSNTKHDSYLLYLMKSKKEQLDVHNRNGTTFGSIDKDSLFGLSIELAPEKIKANFNRLIIPIDDQIKNACKESLELAQLRDFLLPLLMNGQVSVCG